MSSDIYDHLIFNKCIKKIQWEGGISLKILFLGIYPRELKTCAHRKTCTEIFIAALFLIARKWKTTQMIIN